jgi:hypothetical protein
VSANATSRILPAKARVALVARAIEPILNRVVLAGPPVIDLLLDDPAVRTPAFSFAADATLQLLSTSMVDRLGADLQKLGFARTGRSGRADTWGMPSGESVEVVQVREEQTDPAQLALEYATLITMPYAVDEKLIVKIAGAPAMLAIELDAFRRSGAAALDSEELERAMLLIAGRKNIERECASAPPELREVILASLTALKANDSVAYIVQRTIPDTALLPALARRVRERIERIAC